MVYWSTALVEWTQTNYQCSYMHDLNVLPDHFLIIISFYGHTLISFNDLVIPVALKEREKIMNVRNTIIFYLHYLHANYYPRIVIITMFRTIFSHLSSDNLSFSQHFVIITTKIRTTVHMIIIVTPHPRNSDWLLIKK